MKTSTRTVLLVGLLALSPVSYGYGDLLFGAMLKGAMTDERMVNVAPEQKVAPDAVALEMTTVLPCTGPVTVAVTDHVKPEDLALLDQDCK